MLICTGARESIEAFNADRHNFEYFLNFYVHAIKNGMWIAYNHLLVVVSTNFHKNVLFRNVSSAKLLHHDFGKAFKRLSL